MKALKYIFSLSLFILCFTGCEDEDNFDYLDKVELPSNISALFEVAQDNSGLVTITPNADGATIFKVYFGDATTEPVELKSGENIQHTYQEGTYDVKVEAFNIVGDMGEATKVLNVLFRAPENLEVTAEIDGSNPFQVNVSATADYAAAFNVYFDTSNTDEDPTPLALGETVSFEYPSVGDYTVRVVALSGGAETTETTVTVTVNVPVELPIDFEIFDASKFIGFGGVTAEVIDNPDSNGNTSAKVGRMIKGGPETWAGAVIITSAPLDFSAKKLIKLDVWSPRSGGKLLFKLENLSDGGTFIEKEITLQGNSSWEEVTVDLSDIDTALEYQKLVMFFDIGTIGDASSDWTFYIDNIRQEKVPTGATGIIGTWKMASEAGALGVGPAPGDTSWWNCDAGCVAARACYYNDLYVFGSDGAFYNVLGSDSWVEAWQGGSDSCGTPVAPHDGSNPATYVYNEGAGTVTLNGTGAYIGLPKANNAGELPNVAVPNAITYNVSFIDNDTMNVVIETGSGVFWQFRLVRESVTNPLVGVWKMESEAGALGVGPAPGDTSWWNCDAGCVSSRACYYDDLYVFGSDGAFYNVLGADSWIEGWQGGSDSCGTPVAPHDGSNPATYTYDQGAGTVTLNGTGAYIGLPKVNNVGELPNVAVPNAITYSVTFIDSDTISVVIETGSGVFWQYRLVKI